MGTQQWKSMDTGCPFVRSTVPPYGSHVVEVHKICTQFHVMHSTTARSMVPAQPYGGSSSWATYAICSQCYMIGTCKKFLCRFLTSPMDQVVELHMYEHICSPFHTKWPDLWSSFQPMLYIPAIQRQALSTGWCKNICDCEMRCGSFMALPPSDSMLKQYSLKNSDLMDLYLALKKTCFFSVISLCLNRTQKTHTGSNWVSGCRRAGVVVGWV